MKKSVPILLLIFLFSTLLISQERGFKVLAKTADGEVIKLYKGCYALVIGVSDYLSGWPDLPNAVRDADEIGDLLSNLGFKVTKVKNPTKAQLIQELENLIYGSGQHMDNCLVIFFAGHGYTQKMNYGDDIGYIVPRDAPSPERDNSGFMKKAIDMQAIEAYARRIQAKHALFLFDSCFSGAIFNMGRAIPPAYISSKTEKPVRQFITAGEADEVVPDKSIFKRQLINALQGEADRNKDGYVTGTELGDFLQQKVVKYSRGEQHPQYGKINDSRLDRGDFVFVIEKVKIAKAKEIQLPPKPTESERVDLTSVKKSKEERVKIKSQWENRLAEMQSDFDEVERMDKNIDYNFQEKRIAWQKFISSYRENNPFSNEDDNLRQKARQRLNHWQNYKPSKIQPVKEKPTEEAQKQPTVGDDRPLFYIQVGAFNRREIAVSFAEIFNQRGYPAIVLDPFPSDRREMFRVRIGGYATREDAAEIRDRLKTETKGRRTYFIIRS